MRRTSDPSFGPVLIGGQGSRVTDVEGREYFDLTCGYSAANFGHAFPPLIDAVERQLRQLTHVTGLSHVGRIEVAEKLIQYCSPRTSGDLKDHRVIFNTSGSRAVETAIKAAYSFRPGHIVSLGHSYHGRSIATSLLSDTPRIPLPLDESHFLVRRANDYPYCSACEFQNGFPECELAKENPLWSWLRHEAQSLSAVIVEPAMGARGYIVPPSEFFHQLAKVCEETGILLIADEIQMGLGRAGDWLLSKRQGWQADIVVLGKSLGGGIATISAVIGPAEIMNSIASGCESETYAANPIAVACAKEVLHQLECGPWMQRADLVGQTLRLALSDRFGPLEISPATTPSLPLAKVEGLGGWGALEFLSPGRSIDAAAALARRYAVQFLQQGMFVHFSGPYGTRIVLIPPLTIDETDLDEVCQRIRTLPIPD